MTFAPSHFTAVLLFALFASTVFGITQRSTPREMLRYGFFSFFMFVLGTIAAGWPMWLVHH